MGGLDHLAFTVGSLDELERRADLLSAAGLDHSGVVELPPGAILNFEDPDGITWRCSGTESPADPSKPDHRPGDPVSEPVLVREQRGAVLILRLNRPEARNAFNPELMGELGIALADAEADPGVRAVVLTGTGDKAFSAGMDLRAFAQGGSEPTPEQQAGMATFGRFVQGEISVPVVAAAQATAVAGGFELLMGCDVAVASETAQFGLPEVKRALFAAGGGVFISQRIPLAVALELTLTGDYIDAQRAYALGLVNQVVPADQVLDAAVALAERIARNGPLALQATKEIVRLANTDAAKAREKQAEWQPKVFGSDDAKEGATAFIEKRDPVWTGK